MDKRNLYIQACQTYKLGEPIMTDSEFDQLVREMRQEGGYEDLLSKIYDDVGADFDDTGYSISPLESWEEIIRFVSSNIGQELCFTLKFNGVNAKAKTGKTFVAQSRSSENPIDYTDAMKQIVPNIEDECIITGEAFVPDEYLAGLREKYDPEKYKLARSAAISLLRTPEKHDFEDLRKLLFIAYNVDKGFSSKSEIFEWLKTKGFNTPKYVLKTFDGSEDIKEEVRQIMADVDTGEPSDGVVVELNDLTIVPEYNGQYKSTQAAIKVDKWGGTCFRATVRGLDLTPKRGGAGTVLLVDPVRLPDGVTVSRVNAFNPGIVLSEGIEVGSVIRFTRKSNGMCSLIYNAG